MDEVTKSDFVLWRESAVTKRFFQELKERMQAIGGHLVRERAVDYAEYRALCAQYQAYENILGIEFWDGEEEEEVNG